MYTNEARNEIISKLTGFYYAFNYNVSVGSIAKEVEKSLLPYKGMFKDVEGAAAFIAAKDATIHYVGKDENGNYPIRDMDEVTAAVISVVNEDLYRFFDIDDGSASPVESNTENSSQKVEVNNTPTDNDNNMAKVDFGFGTPFDPAQINREMAESFDPSNPARAFLQRPDDLIQPMPQQAPPMPQPVFYGAPPQNPMTYQQPMMQQPPMMNMHPQGMCADPNCACHHQHPVIHKVDEPIKPKKTPPAEDKVETNLAEMFNIDALKKNPIVKVAPEIVQHQIEQVPPQSIAVTNIYNNTDIANKFTKIPLLEIQAIANQNGCSVEMIEYPHDGIITITTFDHQINQVVPIKSFSIDTGMIIDKRAKLIATNTVFEGAPILETAPIYELFNSNGGNKKILDSKMISDIFVAGIMNITKKEMYSEKYKQLNMKLALISMPTKGLNKEERNSLQDYIMKMDQDGYFDSALQYAPGSRFIFITNQLKKNALADFVLSNQGVPTHYGTQAPTVAPVLIESKGGKISIRTAQQQ